MEYSPQNQKWVFYVFNKKMDIEYIPFDPIKGPGLNVRDAVVIQAESSYLKFEFCGWRKVFFDIYQLFQYILN